MRTLQSSVEGMDISDDGEVIVAKLKHRISSTMLCLLELDKLLKGELSWHHWERFVKDYLERMELLTTEEEEEGEEKDRKFPSLRVGDFIDLKVDTMGEAVARILCDVGRERKIEQELQNISGKWEEAKIVLEKWSGRASAEEGESTSTPGRGGSGGERGGGKVSLLVFTNTADHLRELARDCQSLNAILASRSVVAFHRSRIQQEKAHLQAMQGCLRLWERVQAACLTLVRVQCGEDGGGGRLVGFEDDLKKYSRMMNEAMKKPSVKLCCSSANMMRDLERFSEAFRGHLLSCRVLVEESRRKLPRLKLLSYKEVLVILGGWERSGEPGTKHQFLSTVVRLFGTGINSLQTKGRVITGVETCRREVLTLTNPMAYEERTSSVEDFLSELLTETRLSLKDQVFQALKLPRARSFVSLTIEDLVENGRRMSLEQICHLVHEVAWNDGVEEALSQAQPMEAFKPMLIFLIRFMKQLCGHFFGSISSSCPGDESRLRRLVNLYLGKRDLLYKFLHEALIHPDDFLWRSLLRSCWDPYTRQLRLRQGQASIDYSYELHSVPDGQQDEPHCRRATMAMMMALWKDRPILFAGESRSGKKTSLYYLVSLFI